MKGFGHTRRVMDGHRFGVWLSRDQVRRLKRHARLRKVTISALVREGVDTALANPPLYVAAMLKD